MDAAALTSRFPATQDLAGKDMPTYRVAGTDLLAVVSALRDEQGFDLLADLCGLELQGRPVRFGVVIHLLSTANKEYVRLHVDAVDPVTHQRHLDAEQLDEEDKVVARLDHIAARLVADRPHAGLARQWFRSPDVLALLPFDRPSVGHSYGLVWSVPEAYSPL